MLYCGTVESCFTLCSEGAVSRCPAEPRSSDGNQVAGHLALSCRFTQIPPAMLSFVLVVRNIFHVALARSAPLPRCSLMTSPRDLPAMMCRPSDSTTLSAW
jgi:hypothetical protein